MTSEEKLLRSLTRKLDISEADIDELVQELADTDRRVHDKTEHKKELTFLRKVLASHDKDIER